MQRHINNSPASYFITHHWTVFHNRKQFTGFILKIRVRKCFVLVYAVLDWVSNRKSTSELKGRTLKTRWIKPELNFLFTKFVLNVSSLLDTPWRTKRPAKSCHRSRCWRPTRGRGTVHCGRSGWKRNTRRWSASWNRTRRLTTTGSASSRTPTAHAGLARAGSSTSSCATSSGWSLTSLLRIPTPRPRWRSQSWTERLQRCTAGERSVWPTTSRLCGPGTCHASAWRTWWRWDLGRGWRWRFQTWSARG